jgi:cytidylate kinase
MKERLIITIDGPAGAGKSTVSKILAAKLNYIYINTGAMYRVVALESRWRNIDPDDEKGLALLCSGLEIRFSKEDGNLKVFSHGLDVTEEINTPSMSLLASKVSSRRAVRSALVELQRKMGGAGGVILEGRDAGTVIFPQAHIKFYLDANLGERAKRRHKELLSRKQEVELSQVVQETEKRDFDDSHRALAPLVRAEDAVLIDSSELTVEEVVDMMVKIIHARYPSLQNKKSQEVVNINGNGKPDRCSFAKRK